MVSYSKRKSEELSPIILRLKIAFLFYGKMNDEFYLGALLVWNPTSWHPFNLPYISVTMKQKCCKLVSLLACKICSVFHYKAQSCPLCSKLLHMDIKTHGNVVRPKKPAHHFREYINRKNKNEFFVYTLGLSDIIILAIYRDILKVLISRYLLINYHDTIPVHYCHLKGICYAG